MFGRIFARADTNESRDACGHGYCDRCQSVCFFGIGFQFFEGKFQLVNQAHRALGAPQSDLHPRATEKRDHLSNTASTIRAGVWPTSLLTISIRPAQAWLLSATAGTKPIAISNK